MVISLPAHVRAHDLDVRDETGVQNLTSLPRTKWAKLYQQLKKNPTHKRNLYLLASSVASMTLETEDPTVRGEGRGGGGWERGKGEEGEGRGE